MSFPIDNQHKSMFHSNEDFGSEPAPLEVIEQQGLTMLKMGEFFEIEITNYNSTNGTLEARFRRVHPIWWSQVSRPKIAKVKLINLGYQNQVSCPFLKAA